MMWQVWIVFVGLSHAGDGAAIVPTAVQALPDVIARTHGVYSLDPSDADTLGLLGRLTDDEATAPVSGPGSIDRAARDQLGLDSLVLDLIANLEPTATLSDAVHISSSEAARLRAVMASSDVDLLPLLDAAVCPRGAGARIALANHIGTPDVARISMQTLGEIGLFAVSDCPFDAYAPYDDLGVHYDEEQVPMKWATAGRAVVPLFYHHVDVDEGVDEEWDDGSAIVASRSAEDLSVVTAGHALFHPNRKKMRQLERGIFNERTLIFHGNSVIGLGDARVPVVRELVDEWSISPDRAQIVVPPELAPSSSSMAALNPATQPPLPGTEVVLIGYPWRSPLPSRRTFTRATVRRTYAEGFLRLRTTGHKGYSGGAVVDLTTGALVGIISGAADEDVVEYSGLHVVVGGVAAMLPTTVEGYPRVQHQLEAVLELDGVPLERWPEIFVGFLASVPDDVRQTPMEEPSRWSLRAR